MSVVLVYHLYLTSYSSLLLQACALEERLHKTEVELKKNQDEAQKNIQQLNDANSQLVSFALLSILTHVDVVCQKCA